jgi:hypothetical protein
MLKSATCSNELCALKEDLVFFANLPLSQDGTSLL